MIRCSWAIAALIILASAAHAAPGDEKPAVVKDFEARQADPGKSKPGLAANADPGKAKPRKKTVKLTFTTAPRVSARVYYGKKELGTTPFSVDWPRDSGPVDVVVRAHGYLPVNTRAYTFRDDDVSVKLTRMAEAHELLGYRKPVEAPPEEGEDEGEEDAPDAPAIPGTPMKPGVPAAPAAPPPASP